MEKAKKRTYLNADFLRAKRQGAICFALMRLMPTHWLRAFGQWNEIWTWTSDIATDNTVCIWNGTLYNNPIFYIENNILHHSPHSFQKSSTEIPPLLKLIDILVFVYCIQFYLFRHTGQLQSYEYSEKFVCCSFLAYFRAAHAVPFLNFSE